MSPSNNPEVGNSLPEQRPKTHTIKNGDKLVNLARRYDVTLDDIYRANGNLRARNLQIGQTINIPTETISQRREAEMQRQKQERQKVLASVRTGLTPFPEQRHIWSDNPLLFKKYKNGEMSAEDIKIRTEVIGGFEVFNDHGVYFVKVKAGDTIAGIRNALKTKDRFKYLGTKRYTSKYRSFNIPASSLQADIWVPVPLRERDRKVPDRELANHFSAAIIDMLQDPRYGNQVAAILRKVNMNQLITTMLAIAKQESGTGKVGELVFHRWENAYKAFSYTMFHVLDHGAGLKARQRLQMTPGQTYHPRNAGKLLLAFLAEKSNGRADRLFPVPGNEESLASFYNGNWRAVNPHYTTNIAKYYKQSETLFTKKLQTQKKETPKAQPETPATPEVPPKKELTPEQVRTQLQEYTSENNVEAAFDVDAVLRRISTYGNAMGYADPLNATIEFDHNTRHGVIVRYKHSSARKSAYLRI